MAVTENYHVGTHHYVVANRQRAAHLAVYAKAGIVTKGYACASAEVSTALDVNVLARAVEAVSSDKRTKPTYRGKNSVGIIRCRQPSG